MCKGERIINIQCKSFNANAEGYKKTIIDRLIQLRSGYTHTEIVFSCRYGYISFSCTMKDGCCCCRFKFIPYDKHPERWESLTIPCTDAEEDAIWGACCLLAGFPRWFRIGDIKRHMDTTGCSYTIFALKYDKVGVVLCNILPRRILRSREKYAWCTEACIMTLLAGKPDLTDKHPDEFTPDSGHVMVKEYIAGRPRAGLEL